MLFRKVYKEYSTKFTKFFTWEKVEEGSDEKAQQAARKELMSKKTYPAIRHKIIDDRKWEWRHLERTRKKGNKGNP